MRSLDLCACQSSTWSDAHLTHAILQYCCDTSRSTALILIAHQHLIRTNSSSRQEKFASATSPQHASRRFSTRHQSRQLQTCPWFASRVLCSRIKMWNAGVSTCLRPGRTVPSTDRSNPVPRKVNFWTIELGNYGVNYLLNVKELTWESFRIP